MSNDTKLYNYWMEQFKRSGKAQPTDEWKSAKERLTASETDDMGKPKMPVVNGFRNHYESSRAYLDQRDPSFKVVPAAAFRTDPYSIKRAECERTYLESVWLEQDCQRAESRKLNSALLRNIGHTMPTFDTKKWMPKLRYLSADKVRIDMDCHGLVEDAKWWAYKDYMSFKEFALKHPDIDKEELKKLKDKGEYSLDETDIEKINENDRDQYQVVTVWHLFAKDASAMINSKDDDDVDKEGAESLKKETRTRYIKFVEGIHRPLSDSEWPFKLDHSEQILTTLSFNKTPEGVYEYTDYKQMERMDKMSDSVMSYIENDAFFSSVRKFLAGDNLPDDISLDDFMNKSHKSVVPGMLDEGGNPKLKEVMMSQPNQALIGQYELMDDQSQKASGLSELLGESMADLKEVTALGVRSQDAKLHQRVNLRLGGPAGYEKSIQEDAVKLLEIAHQFVPRYSEVLVSAPVEQIDDINGVIIDSEEESIQSLTWPEAQQAILRGGKLLKLGVDAIVGAELAEYWVTTDDVPMEEIRLSTRVSIVAGSTRSITQEQQAESMTMFYTNVLFPTIYQPLRRMDLAVGYLKQIGSLKGLDGIEDYLPTTEEVKQFEQQQQQMEEQQRMAEEQANQQPQNDYQQQMEFEAAKNEQSLENQAVKNELDLQKEIEKAQIQKESKNA